MSNSAAKLWSLTFVLIAAWVLSEQARRADSEAFFRGAGFILGIAWIYVWIKTPGSRKE